MKDRHPFNLPVDLHVLEYCSAASLIVYWLSLIAARETGPMFKRADNCERPSWYEAYCAAMLETDAGKVAKGVDAARRAIHDRALELSSSDTETRELSRAAHFLNHFYVAPSTTRAECRCF